MIEFEDIPVVVVSLESAKERREALDLPFEYEVLLQKPITGVPAASSVALGIIGCTEAHKNAVRYAKEKNAPAILVLEDDAVWIGDDPSEIKCDAPIIFLGAEAVRGTCFDAKTRVAYNVQRTVAVIYRRDAYEKVINLPPTIERLRASKIPVGGRDIDKVLSVDGVHLSKRKLFRTSEAPSLIGHGALTTTTQKIYET